MILALACSAGGGWRVSKWEFGDAQLSPEFSDSFWVLREWAFTWCILHCLRNLSGYFFIVIAGNDNDDGGSWSWYDHIIYENFSRGRSISQRAEARQVRTVFKISQLKISLNVIVPQAESHNLHWRMLSCSLLYLDMFVNIKWSVEWVHTTGRRERRATPGDGVQYLRGILLLQPEFQRQ